MKSEVYEKIESELDRDLKNNFKPKMDVTVDEKCWAKHLESKSLLLVLIDDIKKVP